jgi:phosphoribosyl 1,2-cyclic phosphodiesterase
MQQRHGADVYANAGTIEALERVPKLQGVAWQVFTTGQSFVVGDLTLEPFSVPHDSFDPVGYVVSNGTARIGVVTDMGMATGLIRERLKGCQALVIEANHDVEMLRNSDRPWSLKQRILGRQGHLSNDQAGELVAEVGCDRLECVVLAHLSEDCNHPEVAVSTVRKALDQAGLKQTQVKLTYPVRVVH